MKIMSEQTSQRPDAALEDAYREEIVPALMKEFNTAT
jgi:hypothetical protein